MTTNLNSGQMLLGLWLNQATSGLAIASAAQVRSEIQQHYESARDAAITVGKTQFEAEHIALTSLGAAKTANCQYRRVLLTAAEAKLLRQGNCEARVLSSNAVVLQFLRSAPIGLLCLAAYAFASGESFWARVLVSAGFGLGLVFTATALPLYTPSRARAYRVIKFIGLTACMALACGPNAVKMSWMLPVLFSPLLAIESTRMSLRRKLPVAQWPKQLYL